MLATVRSRAASGECRVVVAVATLAQNAGLKPGEVSRALTRLWLDGCIGLDQAPCATDPSTIDLLADEERGRGGEESERNSSQRSESEKNTEQIGPICAEGVGQAVPGGAAASSRDTRAPRVARDATDEDAERVALARTCADRLGAYDSLPAFVTLARRYGPPRLRDALDTVLALPDARIRKSRAALFTFLVKNGT